MFSISFTVFSNTSNAASSCPEAAKAQDSRNPNQYFSMNHRSGVVSISDAGLLPASTR